MTSDMLRSLRAAATACLLCFFALAVAARSPAAQAIQPLPALAFEENLGQADEPVRFLARGPGYRVVLAAREAAMVFESAGKPVELHLTFDHANPSPGIRGEDLLEHRTNYLVSADPAQNIVGVRSHARVRYESLYPGVDLVVYGHDGQLEYDLIVAPGADPKRIAARFGKASTRVSPQGELVLDVDGLQLRYRKPFAYQDIDGRRVAVPARYAVAPSGAVQFALGAYDRTHPLVIDPILSYSSYAWGASANGVVLDAAGNAYVTGGASNAGPAASNTFQTRIAGNQDVYVAKVDPTGTRLLWATYLGARKASSYGVAIGLDASGNVYVTGRTDSASFPVTAGAYQTSFTSGSFVSKLNPTGTALLYSTFIDSATTTAMAVDGAGNAYLTGNASGLVATPGAFQGTRPGAGTSPFAAKLNPSGSAMAYATYLGGSGTDTAAAIAVDAAGNAYLTGTTTSSDFPVMNAFRTALQGPRDAFVAKLDATGSSLVYSTYLGGSSYDGGKGIAVDAQGQATVVGQAYSDNFPVTAGSFQPRKGTTSPNFSNGFVTRFSASGTTLVYSSYLGGQWCRQPGTGTNCDQGGLLGEGDGLSAVAIDAAGFAYVGGWSISGQFPQVEPFQDVPAYFSEYMRELFFAKIRPAGDAVVYTDVLGGRDFDLQVNGIAADLSGGAFFVGASTTNLPFTAGAQTTVNGTGAIVRITPGRYPTSVRSSLDPAGAGETVTLTADVQDPTQGGSVTFYDGAAVLGTAPAAGGRAVLTVSLPPGIHKISAVSSGDAQPSLPLFQVVKGQ